MRYPPVFIDRLRQHFRLSEMIGMRVQLRRTGREFTGLCPFHNEKSPSFTVNDEKGFYHCFGCGAHGDVISFVREVDGLNYREAIESLAGQAGISLPEITPGQRQEIDRTERLYQAMEAAAQWFTLQLKQLGGAGARSYLEERGLNDETIREFRLGFAPGKRTALKDALQQRDFPETLLFEAGLLVRPEGGGESYDKFRDRIIFPIGDSSGRVIAFGGRLIDKEAKGPKYLNSPDTPLFKKSYNLYRFDVARRKTREAGTLIFAEGYMDVIALCEAGLTHSVAPLGTAITREQLAMAWQVADEPILCLDGDAAGFRAMERALELALPLLKPGKSLRFVRLPQGEDPDSLLRQGGAEGLKRFFAAPQPLSDMLWQKHMRTHASATPEQAAGAQQALMQVIEKIEDRSVRDHYRQAMKDRLYHKRGAERAAASKKNGKRFAGNAKAPPESNLQQSPLTMLPIKGRRDHAREECLRGLLALACHFPRMLDDGLEESLAQAEFAEGYMVRMRDRLLEHAPGAAGRVMLIDELKRLDADAWQRFEAHLLQKYLPRSLWPQDESEGYLQAAAWRQHLEKRLELLHLDEEYREAEANLARRMDEPGLNRLEHLRQRLQQLRDSNEFFPEKEGL